MIRATLVAAAALLSSSTALAQTTPAAAKPKPKDVPPEVERGFYSEFDFGTLAFLGGDAATNVQPGVMAGFGIGTDLGRYLKFEVRMLNSTADSGGTCEESSALHPFESTTLARVSIQHGERHRSSAANHRFAGLYGRAYSPATASVQIVDTPRAVSSRSPRSRIRIRSPTRAHT